MTILNLSGQQIEYQDVAPKLNQEIKEIMRRQQEHDETIRLEILIEIRNILRELKKNNEEI